MKTPARRPALVASLALAIALALAPAAAHADPQGDAGATHDSAASAQTADLAETGVREDALVAGGIAAVAFSGGVLALALGRVRRISAAR
ncbi:hypothetical protein [Salinibacterium sp. ZJ70]|uniref:hypothetical protein n=1 Tax=Salinibacterium sp. ZJ70 TaxID=2708084 RepID=UPI00141E8F9B|nr:hypothetical protein [Salinibacterium sp. ZJ70]